MPLNLEVYNDLQSHFFALKNYWKAQGFGIKASIFKKLNKRQNLPIFSALYFWVKFKFFILADFKGSQLRFESKIVKK